MPTLWEIIISKLKYITDVLKRKRHFVTTVALGLALVVCFIMLLTQINAVSTQKTEFTEKFSQKEKEIGQKESEIRDLTFSVQALENANQLFIRDNGELEKELDSRTSTTSRTFGDLRRQVGYQEEENQKLQAQLIEKDAEIRRLRSDKTAARNEVQELKKQLVRSDQGVVDQDADIQRLEKEKAEISIKNRELQRQLVDKTSEAKNLTNRVKRLQNEKMETQYQNQKLQGENTDLVRQNQNLRNENASLRGQLDKAKEKNSNEILDPELPKRSQYGRNVVTRSVSHNNQGCEDFRRDNYEEAVKQFKQAIKADSKFAVAHYNLGCAYLEMKEYRDAIEAFSKAVAINYRFKEAYYNLGLAHLGSGARGAAKSSAELALKTDKNYKSARNLLAVIEKVQQ